MNILIYTPIQQLLILKIIKCKKKQDCTFKLYAERILLQKKSSEIKSSWFEMRKKLVNKLWEQFQNLWCYNSFSLTKIDENLEGY